MLTGSWQGSLLPEDGAGQVLSSIPLLTGSVWVPRLHGARLDGPRRSLPCGKDSGFLRTVCTFL